MTIPEVGDQKKVCPQCNKEKLLATQFYRKNSKDGYMRVCKDCHNAEKQERARLALETQKQRAREEEEQKARQEQIAEEERQKQRALLNAWFAEQPPRKCIACGRVKAASAFEYPGRDFQNLVASPPIQFYQRCIPCHEKYRERNLIPCVLCQQGIKDPMNYFDGYALFGGGTRVSICCRSCEAAFQALPVSQQYFYVRARVNLLFPAPQVIYAEVDPRSQQTCYIGRTGHAQRRQSEHKRNIHEGPAMLTVRDPETGKYREIEWTTRANWMHELKQQGLEAKQRILHDVQPATYIIEYELRFIWHAIQQKWPILNCKSRDYDSGICIIALVSRQPA